MWNKNICKVKRPWKHAMMLAQWVNSVVSAMKYRATSRCENRLMRSLTSGQYECSFSTEFAQSIFFLSPFGLSVHSHNGHGKNDQEFNASNAKQIQCLSVSNSWTQAFTTVGFYWTAFQSNTGGWQKLLVVLAQNVNTCSTTTANL